MTTARRSLVSYLIMPRPKDLVKGTLIPVTYLLGAVAAGGVTVESLTRAAVTVAAVELLIYPARYQWNDARGFVADQRHPDNAARGRLPGPIAHARSHVLTSCAVAALRVLAVAVLVVALPALHLGGVLAFATVGIFGVAAVYEWLRSRFTGRTGLIPPPLRVGVLLIWLVVGAGYAVRGMIGLALALDMPANPVLALSAAVTLWAYGVAFVTSRWAVEALAFASERAGRVVFEARASQAREHLLVLVRWLPRRLPSPGLGVERWAPLAVRTSLVAPWNVAMLVAGSASGIAGRLLCGPASNGDLLVAAGAATALTTLVVVTTRARHATVLFGAAALGSCLVLASPPKPLIGVLPWLSVSVAYLFFSSRSRHALGRPGLLTRWLKAAAGAAARSVLGDETWAAVHAAGHDGGIADRSPAAVTELVDVARIASEAGARVAMQWWMDRTQLEVQQKRGPRDLVSRADRETEAAIRDVLAELRPGDGVLGEEGGNAHGDSDIRWVVDPIDGTTSYLYGRSDWAVSVAAVRCSDGVVVAAAVQEPVAGWTTTAQRNCGTHLNGRRVTVNGESDLERTLVEVNFGRDDQREVAGLMVNELATRVRDLRRGGSAACALAHLATGRADAVWAPGLQSWDGAAGLLLVEEAGGLVGDLSGICNGVWPASGDVLAANPELWPALRSILSPVYALKGLAALNSGI
jgi:fructose-1,6-bisphosphatase/inositol monophosphatase family enzyme